MQPAISVTLHLQAQQDSQVALGGAEHWQDCLCTFPLNMQHVSTHKTPPPLIPLLHLFPCLVVFHIYIYMISHAPLPTLYLLLFYLPLSLPVCLFFLPLPSWKCQHKLLSALHPNPPIVRQRWRGMLSQEKFLVATCALYRNKSRVSQIKKTNTHMLYLSLLL